MELETLEFSAIGHFLQNFFLFEKVQRIMLTRVKAESFHGKKHLQLL